MSAWSKCTLLFRETSDDNASRRSKRFQLFSPACNSLFVQPTYVSNPKCQSLSTLRLDADVVIARCQLVQYEEAGAIGGGGARQSCSLAGCGHFRAHNRG